jgi:hypothetical protein
MKGIMTTPDRERNDLRDDADYWDDLAERVSRSAAQASRETTLDWLAEPRAGIAVGCFLLAAALALTTRTRPAETPADLALFIVPSDQAGQTILLSAHPPAIGGLLLSERGERAR